MTKQFALINNDNQLFLYMEQNTAFFGSVFETLLLFHIQFYACISSCKFESTLSVTFFSVHKIYLMILVNVMDLKISGDKNNISKNVAVR